MTQPIPDPNPLDTPEAAGDTFREDDLIETTGAEDSAWEEDDAQWGCLLYTSPSPRDATLSRMPSSA